MGGRSVLVRKAHENTQNWFIEIDSFIKENIDALTCSDIKEIYFSLFRELKQWRSTSSLFTGFSELLLFRNLIHTIPEGFTPVKTGNINSHPILFKSDNYTLGQGIRKEFNGVRKYPDISVEYKGNLKSIAQIKIVMGSGQKQLDKEVKTFKIMKNAYPNLKGLFISYIKGAFSEEKQKPLQKAGLKTVTLEDNKELIKNVLQYLI